MRQLWQRFRMWLWWTQLKGALDDPIPETCACCDGYLGQERYFECPHCGVN